MIGSPTAGATVRALEARVQRCLTRDYRTSWPMLMHMAVSDYVVSEASGGGLQAELAALLRSHKLEMVYYAAAPDGNGITPTYHIYRPGATGWKGGGVKTVVYWFNGMATMLQAGEGTKAARAGAALSHFTADLACPVHTVSDGDLHSAYENWLKRIFERRTRDPQGYGQLYTRLRERTHAGVTQDRRVVDDVAEATVQDLVGGAHASYPQLRDLWAAKRASSGDDGPADGALIELTARRFASAANFTADLWYTAFERARGTLPPPDPYLYKRCPDYDACLDRLEARVLDLLS